MFTVKIIKGNILLKCFKDHSKLITSINVLNSHHGLFFIPTSMRHTQSLHSKYMAILAFIQGTLASVLTILLLVFICRCFSHVLICHFVGWSSVVYRKRKKWLYLLQLKIILDVSPVFATRKTLNILFKKLTIMSNISLLHKKSPGLIQQVHISPKGASKHLD